MSEGELTGVLESVTVASVTESMAFSAAVFVFIFVEAVSVGLVVLAAVALPVEGNVVAVLADVDGISVLILDSVSPVDMSVVLLDGSVAVPPEASVFKVGSVLMETAGVAGVDEEDTFAGSCFTIESSEVGKDAMFCGGAEKLVRHSSCSQNWFPVIYVIISEPHRQ